MDKEKIVKKYTSKFRNFVLFLRDNSLLSKNIEKKVNELQKEKFFIIKEFFDKEEPQIIIVKNYKIIDVIKGNFDVNSVKRKLKEYFDLDKVEEKFVLDNLNKEKLEIEKKIEEEVNKKFEEYLKKAKYGLKRSFDVGMMLRIILMVFIVTLLIKLMIGVINSFMEVYYKGKEAQFIKDLYEKVDTLSKREDGSFIRGEIEVPSSRIKLVCFTYSKNVAETFNKEYKFENVDFEGFTRNNDIKALSENAQKNVFFIYNIYSFKSIKIQGLQSSIFEKNPLCFKPGETYYLVNYHNVIFITKNLSKFEN